MGANQNDNLVAFTMGLPGTGKTCFTSLLSASGAIERISTDEIRVEKAIESGNETADELVYRIAIQRAIVQAARKHVVIDATFYKYRYRELLYQYAKTEGLCLCCFLFSMPKEVILERIQSRRNSEKSLLRSQGVKEDAAFLKICDEFEPLGDRDIGVIEFIVELEQKKRTWGYKMFKATADSRLSVVEGLLWIASVGHFEK